MVCEPVLRAGVWSVVCGHVLRAGGWSVMCGHALHAGVWTARTCLLWSLERWSVDLWSRLLQCCVRTCCSAARGQTEEGRHVAVLREDGRRRDDVLQCCVRMDREGRTCCYVSMLAELSFNFNAE